MIINIIRYKSMYICHFILFLMTKFAIYFYWSWLNHGICLALIWIIIYLFIYFSLCIMLMHACEKIISKYFFGLYKIWCMEDDHVTGSCVFGNGNDIFLSLYIYFFIFSVYINYKETLSWYAHVLTTNFFFFFNKFELIWFKSHKGIAKAN